MMALTDVRDRIREHVVQQLLFGDASGLVADEESLIDNGVIDSTGVIDLVAYVEDCWDVQVEDDEIVPDNFDTIARLAAYVVKKRA